MKTILRFLLALLLCINAHAAMCQVSYGVKAGLGLTKARFSNDFVEDTDFDIRFQAGGFVRAPLSQKFFLQSEVLFAQKGWKVDDGSTTLTYLNIPVLIGIQVEKFSFYGGGEVGFKLTEKPDLPTEIYENFDICLLGGLSYMVSPQLGIDLRYSHGLANLIEVHLRDPQNQDLGELRDGKNVAIQLSVFYVLNRAD